MDKCTCYLTKWTSIGSTTNKRTLFACCVFHWHFIVNVCLNVCVAMKKLIIREYIYIYIIFHGKCWRTIFTHEFVFTKRTGAALLCFNNSFSSTVVRKVRVVSEVTLWFVRWVLSLLTSISFALDQLLPDFFCSIISIQSAFGLFMDSGLF